MFFLSSSTPNLWSSCFISFWMKDIDNLYSLLLTKVAHCSASKLSLWSLHFEVYAEATSPKANTSCQERQRYRYEEPTTPLLILIGTQNSTRRLKLNVINISSTHYFAFCISVRHIIHSPFGSVELKIHWKTERTFSPTYGFHIWTMINKS